ncbi:glycoside hydrolase family 92 protein [Niabella ginsengisoli]|uniref:glycoside hydrolase family 92 protein n=1 Tax=Niabella ginsengisoli TaxID=522298 RepID=UPI0021D42F90|nr:glycoside hydrolase family 92 protein [Niabella ginsengisoli]
MYFSAKVDRKPSSFGAFNGEAIKAGAKMAKGKGAGIYLTFSTDHNEAITVTSGLSYTSIQNARLNLEAEAKDLSFDQARLRATNSWNQYLGRINVEGGKDEDMTKFYTGLYHALLGRGLASDVNGAYPKNDGSVGQIPLDKSGKPLHNHYNTDAVWGTYWNLTQLWALVYPEYYADFVKSQLLVYKDAGWLGDGIACSRYVSGVGTNFVGLVIASAYLCGIDDFDTKVGYEAARKNELEWRDRPFGAGKADLDRFIKYGYVNHLDSGDAGGERWQFSASHTLEYAFSAHAVAEWAKRLGKTKDYKQLLALSKAWERIYDPSLKLIHPKLANGKFIENFDPSQPWRGFQEGNAWQYTYFVPHHIESLIDKMGAQTFNSRLDSIFKVSEKNLFGGGSTIDAFAGISGIYNHGNQPNLHVSWLFNYSGKPSLTQKWVRAICNKFYGTEGVHGYGFGQDEDQGQLGAWYVMSALGLFDIKGLTDSDAAFGIGSPLFKKITLQLSPKYYGSKKFIIDAPNSSDKNMFIQSMKLDNQALHKPFVSFKDVVNGGRLSLEMAAKEKNNY